MVFNRKSEPLAEPVSPSMVRLSEPPRTDRPAFSNMAPSPAVYEPPILESVIGNDLSIEGETITIRCKGSLKILGNIQADLHSKRLEVGREANINGAIAADTIDVYGRVHGAILGARVILHAGADVEGDIVSQLLSVEEGANFDGRSRRVNNPADIAPQLERPIEGQAVTGAQSYNLSSDLPKGGQAPFARPIVSQQASPLVTQLN
jgi:cytoskeletal protein CcmA (bactofilin family)